MRTIRLLFRQSVTSTPSVLHSDLTAQINTNSYHTIKERIILHNPYFPGLLGHVGSTDLSYSIAGVKINIY